MKPGEIYETNFNNEKVVVVAVTSDFCNVLRLSDERKHDNDLDISCRDLSKVVMYTNPLMLSWKFNSGFDKMIGTVPEKEFAKITDAIRTHFGCTTERVSAPVPAEVVKPEQPKEPTFTMSADIVQKIMSCTQVETERDIYKHLYESTLDRLIARAEK